MTEQQKKIGDLITAIGKEHVKVFGTLFDASFASGVIADALATATQQAEDDTRRLDFLDKCNRGLNNYYGTNYGWELILNHNVTRLMIEGHINWVDLNDSKGGNDKLKSCRDAIDKAMQALSKKGSDAKTHS